MKKVFPWMVIGLVVSSVLPAFGQTLTKTPNHVYIATFNVYVLGALDAKYEDIVDWDPVLDDSIPERISNLANVIAVGGYNQADDHPGERQ